MAAAALLISAAADAQNPASSLSTEQLGDTCDRACLREIMDKYLTALVAHDSDRLDLATHVRFTENGVVLPIGTALWRTASGLGEFGQYFVDAKGHSVAFLGTVKERDTKSILSVRLKLQDRVIEEIEQLVVRSPQSAAAWDQRVQPGARTYSTQGWGDTLKPSERVSRERMVAIANSYFSSIQGGSATPVPFAADCYRIENGEVTSGAPKTGADAPVQTGRAVFINSVADRSCAEQLNAKGAFIFNNDLRDRRFLVVDEETGTVFTHVFFDHAGKFTERTLPDGTKRPISSRVLLPGTLAIHEVFWIRNGVIQHIAANILSVPYGMSSGWEN
ncbi:hypothetical protein CMV14_15920 [Rhizorhabdus dicambivorans]|nr:hypothetical protein CMV14_15920 [Rhizorhabdus dicambivorans]